MTRLRREKETCALGNIELYFLFTEWKVQKGNPTLSGFGDFI